MDVSTIDHLEFYVENAAEAAASLCTYFGFQVHGMGTPETGLVDCHSILLRQREITILLTSALSARHPAADYVRRHGDGVAVIAMAVPDARRAFGEAIRGGAEQIDPPTVLKDADGSVTFACVTGFGDVTHRFVARDSLVARFAPGLIKETLRVPGSSRLLQAIDHIAVCVPAGELVRTVRRYQEAFGFAEIFEERIVVGPQAMNSKVVQSQSGAVTFTILEPDPSAEPGQIDEFIRSHDGPGVQHVAFSTDDIVLGVQTTSAAGVTFLNTPSSYYGMIAHRLGHVGVPVEQLRQLSILADRDEWGVMLQIFTESRHPRRTLFYELIERRGARTFGSNNIKALYEAVERHERQIKL
jgi:4-hydroxymandelate synthase